MLTRGLWLLTILPLSTAILAETCEPPPDHGDEDHFPEGAYEFQSAYAFSFSDVPNILTMYGTAEGLDASNGDLASTYYWAFWDNRTNYESDPTTPDCYFVEQVTGLDHPQGSVPGTPYFSCTGCDPFADLYFAYIDNVGCSQELFNYWYVDPETGEFLGSAPLLVGYRHAQTEGWPDEFMENVPALEAYGYEGTLYDELVQLGLLAPNYYVAPLQSGTRAPALRIPPKLMPAPAGLKRGVR